MAGPQSTPVLVLVANVNATPTQVAIKNSTIITAIKTEPIKEFRPNRIRLAESKIRYS